MSAAARTLATYLALLALLAATVGSAFVELGLGNAVLNVAIAAVKSVLVVVVFMRFLSGDALPRLAAAAMLLWLAILFGLTLAARLA
ncbi:oxidase [Aquibium sp. A9E412]|uniref:oxidase n=1 Tax=Aquibium sp. A9E412 TaxID=2976767 RepID=UPI0025B03DBA|nr:oxidase [Aquibium sp. A9E412]MDN2566026.1 oxidase [Aquibium sp. A9E412]